MKKIRQGTGLTAEDLENDPEAMRTKKLTTFNDDDLEKAYTREQVQGDETATYSSLSKQVGSKLQTPSDNPPSSSTRKLEIDQPDTEFTASDLTLRNESILGQYFTDNALESDSISTGNTRKSRVKLETHDIRNQFTGEFNNMIQQEKEVNKTKLEFIEALLLASAPETYHPSTYPPGTGNDSQRDAYYISKASWYTSVRLVIFTTYKSML